MAPAPGHLPHALWLPLAVPLLLEFGWKNNNALLWGMTVVEAAAVVVLVAAQRRRGLVCSMLGAPLLVWLGKLSYGIYLWHYPVVRYLRDAYEWPIVVALGLPISCLLAALSLHTVERWALRWRDGRPQGAPALGAARPQASNA